MQELIASDLRKFGAIKSSIRLLGEASHQNINYLDLIPSSATHPNNRDALCPSAVIETSGVALAYVLPADALSQTPQDKTRLNRLRHNLACRGDAEYLVVWKPGELQLYPVGLSKDIPGYITVLQSDPGASLLFQDMANAVLKTESTKRSDRARQAQQVIFDVLNYVGAKLHFSPAFIDEHPNVNLIIICALFTRFLIDRGIINRTTFPEICSDGHPEQCFDTPELAATTCQWLHDRFNGELPQLSGNNYVEYFSLLASKDENVFDHLSTIFHRAYAGDDSFALYWDSINFAHVPVSILALAHKHCAHGYSYPDIDSNGISRIPRFIAGYLTDQALAGINTTHLDRAKILDSAVSGGNHLELCLRKLVATRWESAGERPGTKEIRKILDDQIFGFDIDHAALRISALSLYLAALELNPEPHTQKSLRFETLLTHNLVSMPHPTKRPVEHAGKYDLVIGKRPDNTDPLSHVWRAAKWAKNGGVIAVELDTDLLANCSEIGLNARNSLLSTVRVTGVLNGGDLDDPFHLLFAVNLKPAEADIFYMISPVHDEHLWHAGRFRIDYAEAQPMQFSFLRNNPTLVNELSTGTSLDVDATRRVRALLPTIAESSEDDWNEDESTQRYAPTAICLGDYWDIKPGQIELGKSPLAIKQSIFSAGSNEYAHGKEIEKYLFLLANSELFSYYMLMTKSRLWVESQTIDAEDLANFPIIAYQDISQSKKEELQKLMVNLGHESTEADWAKLNKCVYDLYQLDSPDQLVIADTLATRIPIKSVRSSANQIPDDAQVNHFCSKLETSLRSFFNEVGSDVKCCRLNHHSASWIFIDVTSNEFKGDTNEYFPAIKLFEQLDNNEGATRVMLNMDRGYLCVGIIAQSLFFTESRAKLCALEILRHRSELILGSVDG